MCVLAHSSLGDALKALLKELPEELGRRSFDEARQLWQDRTVTAKEAVSYIIAELPPLLRRGNLNLYEILNDDRACCAFLESGL